jgi:hypothetical protein
VAEVIAEVIADGRPTNEPGPTTQSVAQTLSMIGETLFDGNVAKFARAIGKQKNTVWGWCQGDSRILLKDLVNLCYCLQVRPRDLLAGSVSPEHLSRINLRPSLIKAGQRRASRQLNRRLLEEKLLNILDGQSVPSMQQVALLLGFDKRLLYRHFSDICRAIAKKHKREYAARHSRSLQFSVSLSD